MSAQADLIVVGQFSGVFGVKGWLKVKSFTQPEENILSYVPWYIDSVNGLQEISIDAHQMRPQGLVVHLKGIDDRDLAAQLGRQTIWVTKSLMKPLPAGEFYWHQLIGLSVVSQFMGQRLVLGRVADMMDTGANDVMVVEATEQSIDQRERLIPYVIPQYVSAIDLNAREILVDWDPEF